MSIDVIIANLEDQALDRDYMANGEEDSIFAKDAKNLRDAIAILKAVKVLLGNDAGVGGRML